jgi:hypothetical protein
MPSFRDTAGTEWRVKVTVGSLRRCIDEAGFDLLNLFGQKDAMEEGAAGDEVDTADKPPPPVFQLFTDLDLLGRCLFAVVKPQADAERIGCDEFLELLSGDSIEEARRALLESCVDFYPSPAVRRAYRKMTDAVLRAWAKVDAETERVTNVQTLVEESPEERGEASTS